MFHPKNQLFCSNACGIRYDDKIVEVVCLLRIAYRFSKYISFLLSGKSQNGELFTEMFEIKCTVIVIGLLKITYCSPQAELHGLTI